MLTPLLLDPPAEGTSVELLPGIRWIRMPLPFALNHVNLWIMDDDDGWFSIDAGLHGNRTQAAWEAVLARLPRRHGLARLLVTHYHPDHAGSAGWLVRKTGADLLMSQTEWTFAHALRLQGDADMAALQAEHCHAAGLAPSVAAALTDRGNAYRTGVGPLPLRYRRVRDLDSVSIGGQMWRASAVAGHAPEMLLLHNLSEKILIAADHILPTISPNVSVWPQDPYADPLTDFLADMERFLTLPDDTVILPSHGLPFRGGAERARQLIAHHAERLEATWNACASPASIAEVMNILFPRALDTHQTVFAVGETLAHLNHLVAKGQLRRDLGASRTEQGHGPWTFRQR